MKRKKELKISGAVILAAVSVVVLFSGCPAAITPEDAKVTRYGLSLDKTKHSQYVATGGGFVKPDNLVITVTNTGDAPLTGINAVVWANSQTNAADVAIAGEFKTTGISSLAAGASGTVTVTFPASSQGQKKYGLSVLVGNNKAAAKMNPLDYVECTFTAAPTGMSVSPAQLQVGGTATATVTGAAATGKGNKAWTSSDSSIASIDANGAIRAGTKPGTVKIGYVENLTTTATFRFVNLTVVEP